MATKLIVIMIDGISSDYYAEYAQFMPHTHALAQNGNVINNLAPEKCASSLPGRASMLTGLSSRHHGIYGNNIWDSVDNTFRYASPYDIRTPTLFAHATKSGLDTANIGFGMTRPEDCSLYQPPHWVGDFITRNRANQSIPVTQDWQNALAVVDDGRIEFAKSSIAAASPHDHSAFETSIMSELVHDQQMIQIVNGIVSSSKPPDLVFTEINVTDTMQHKFGYASVNANFSIAFADMLVGLVMQTLRKSGLDSEYTVIVTSDHGHGDTVGALYVDQVLDDQNWSAECAVLFLENNEKVDSSLHALAPYGAELLDDSFLPEDVQGKILPVAVKDKIAFEVAPPGNLMQTGQSKYLSSHSYYPGTRSDLRFAVISGPETEKRPIEHATAAELYQIMADILGLSL